MSATDRAHKTLPQGRGETRAMGSTAKTDWMDEARIIAAQCWCTPETSGIEMNVELAEVFAQRLAAWINTAAQNQRNADYWHGRAENAALIRALKNADPQEKE